LDKGKGVMGLARYAGNASPRAIPIAGHRRTTRRRTAGTPLQKLIIITTDNRQ